MAEMTARARKGSLSNYLSDLLKKTRQNDIIVVLPRLCLAQYLWNRCDGFLAFLCFPSEPTPLYSASCEDAVYSRDQQQGNQRRKAQSGNDGCCHWRLVVS